ncbi:hypothetical protein [Novosphingobium huizhouense]|uniref:hypothetical protein n=1 Tax=Novosphingobium huizhouense TaxID=2866625 RepID=UPI001CD908F3|nr:hypothetical protein [Novosphingobium huizhouense]
MRVALLSSLDTLPGEPQILRGSLLVGGRTVLRHQLALALAFGCKRIVALSENLTGELVALQHVAEQQGARFHVVASTRAIVPLVAPEDELLVVADGLLALPVDALALLEKAPGVLTLPVEAGIAAGFERIDINHAFAGMMRLPGRIVAGLGDLPSEWNPVSALLRLAVQARQPMRDLPGAMLGEARWQLVRSEAEAQQVERRWLAHNSAADPSVAPVAVLAAVALRYAGPSLLHAGTRPPVIRLGALVLLLLALGAGWFGWTPVGLLLCALAAVIASGADKLAQIERNALLAGPLRALLAPLVAIALDVAIVALCAWRSSLALAPGATGLLRWFAPLVLVLLLRLLAIVAPPSRTAEWLGDRLALALALSAMSLLSAFDGALAGSIIALLGGCVVWLRKVRSGPTRDGQAPNPALTSNA